MGRTHQLQLLAALIAVAAALAPRVHAGADARFACGFETSWSACGFGEQARARDRISLIEVAGRPGVRLRTLPGDREIAGSGAAERADLALSPEATGCVEGREQWWAHSLLFQIGRASLGKECQSTCRLVTGVQTCALPICRQRGSRARGPGALTRGDRLR